MTTMKRGYVEYNHGDGWTVQWYRDDDDNSGYGDNPRVAKIYGDRAYCMALAEKTEPPDGTHWRPIKGWEPNISAGSAAWCESYGDSK